jgi:hypothetical protein
MIVTHCPKAPSRGRAARKRRKPLRQKTAEIFDTLFLSPTINPANNAALRIDSAMQKLHNLLPVRERPLNARNIAYAEVTTASGKREVYVSVSGAQGSTSACRCFAMGANHVRIGNTTYINIDYNPAFPRTSLEVTEQGQLLAVPLTIKDLKTYQPTQTSRPTSLDSESKLISVLREKYPDPKEIRSVDIATTMRPCESCSVVMKQFGHDGGDSVAGAVGLITDAASGRRAWRRAAIGDQLLVVAILGHLPAIEHQHPIGLLHRRQAMGNDQRGAAAEEARHGLMQVVFGGGIEGRGGFVEDHHFRLGDHPRNARRWR